MALRSLLFFGRFFGQKWTQKGQEHNFLAFRDFLSLILLTDQALTFPEH